MEVKGLDRMVFQFQYSKNGDDDLDGMEGEIYYYAQGSGYAG